MFFHARQQSVARKEIALVIVKNPGRNLVVPDQIVTHDKHVVLLAKGDILIGKIESILAGLRMNPLPLKDILRRNGVELRFDESIAALILSGDLRLVDGGADDEVALEG